MRDFFDTIIGNTIFVFIVLMAVQYAVLGVIAFVFWDASPLISFWVFRVCVVVALVAAIASTIEMHKKGKLK